MNYSNIENVGQRKMFSIYICSEDNRAVGQGWDKKNRTNVYSNILKSGGGWGAGGRRGWREKSQKEFLHTFPPTYSKKKKHTHTQQRQTAWSQSVHKVETSLTLYNHTFYAAIDAGLLCEGGIKFHSYAQTQGC